MVDIRDKALAVRNDHHGTADVSVVAVGATWLQFVAKERGLLGSGVASKDPHHKDHSGFWRRSRAAFLRKRGRNYETRRRE